MKKILFLLTSILYMGVLVAIAVGGQHEVRFENNNGERVLTVDGGKIPIPSDAIGAIVYEDEDGKPAVTKFIKEGESVEPEEGAAAMWGDLPSDATIVMKIGEDDQPQLDIPGKGQHEARLEDSNGERVLTVDGEKISIPSDAIGVIVYADKDGKPAVTKFIKEGESVEPEE
jgi:hypothetical protein